MTAQFWKFLIGNGHGLEIRFVADEDRAWAERLLEGDPALLSYRTEPQFVFPLDSDPPNGYSSSFGGPVHKNEKWR